MTSKHRSDAELQPRAPQRRSGHDRVAALLDAAAAVFVERGYEVATMTEVASRAGASIGSLYQFFPTKPVLAEALHLRELGALTAALESSPVSTPETLAATADRLFDRLMTFSAERPVFPLLAERRDIAPDRKAKTRAEMRASIASLLLQAHPAPTASRAASAAALLLVLMKAAVSLRVEASPGWEDLVLELRSMLRDRLADPVRS